LLGSGKSGVSRVASTATNWGISAVPLHLRYCDIYVCYGGIYSSRLEAAPGARPWIPLLAGPPVQLPKLSRGAQEVADVTRQRTGLLGYTGDPIRTRTSVRHAEADEVQV
jgi:hypothetical protein